MIPPRCSPAIYRKYSGFRPIPRLRCGILWLAFTGSAFAGPDGEGKLSGKADPETFGKSTSFDPAAFARYLGYMRGSQLRITFGPASSREETRLPAEEMIAGFRDGLEGKDTPLPVDVAQRMAKTLDATVKAAKEKEAAVAEKEAAAFFAENAKKPGVRTLPSGIQYEVLKEGDGPLVDPQGGLQIRYTTRLLDGTEVESNAAGSEPSFVTLDQFVPGSQIVALSMPAGSHWRIWLPSRLAYGAEGSLPKIRPGQALCIEQEVVAIFPPGERPPGTPAPMPPGGFPSLPQSPPASPKAGGF